MDQKDLDIILSDRDNAELVLSIMDDDKKERIILLQFHLYTETLLERIILTKLPRGDRLIEKGNLGYFQKLVLVDSFNIINDKIIQALKKTNKLRNDCSHQHNKEITLSDIDLIGRPLGKKYSHIKTLNDADLIEQRMRLTFGYVGGRLLAATKRSENPQDNIEDLIPE